MIFAVGASRYIAMSARRLGCRLLEKAGSGEVVRADIEAQASLADGIDEALASGQATKTHKGEYQLACQVDTQINGAEVDRWRKLRAMESMRRWRAGRRHGQATPITLIGRR